MEVFMKQPKSLNWKLLASAEFEKFQSDSQGKVRNEPEEKYRSLMIESAPVVISEMKKSFKSLELGIRGLFSEVQKFLKLLMAVPISSATDERTFSILRRIKDYLRSTMAQ
ncbi:unnamed protein product, partial [Allacma fusca]